MGKILPILLALIGLAAGVGAGYAFKPAPEIPLASASGEGDGDPAYAAADPAIPEPHPDDSESDFVKLNNQFVIPVVDEGSVSALVVMSLSLEVAAGGSAAVYQREPKLRDAYLQVLFDHANVGGFSGAFTEGEKMNMLRSALKEASVRTLGSVVIDILITDIVRQDL